MCMLTLYDFTRDKVLSHFLKTFCSQKNSESKPGYGQLADYLHRHDHISKQQEYLTSAVIKKLSFVFS